jgi:hypothetical protein
VKINLFNLDYISHKKGPQFPEALKICLQIRHSLIDYDYAWIACT